MDRKDDLVRVSKDGIYFVHVVYERRVMASNARGLRVPEDLQREIEREMEGRNATWSAAAIELLRESVRMRRVPGIVFVDGSAGRSWRGRGWMSGKSLLPGGRSVGIMRRYERRIAG